ncbi:nitrous oxide-stimulated promoter family protein [Paenibacillus oralis]|uniref:Nitrous oxide-stimulated promoter family protein n=1 Tax=Paenibacillus oralis TaxID=2490856 RepID=A0A3P3UAP4_9BACL|nr:nitrous oxide-stimulated promoter family protein [Paenibacillus oralis]
MQSEKEGPRIRREQMTVALMISLYCRQRHGKRERTSRDEIAAESVPGLCPECAELLRYARERLARCRFGEDKTTCRACAVHCYAPKQRDTIRKIMAYAGPKMLLRHPILTVRHLFDDRK